VRKKYHTRRKSIREEYSLVRYSLRTTIDDGLHSDVSAFLAKHDTSLDNLAWKLLNNKFAFERFSDPSYPM